MYAKYGKLNISLPKETDLEKLSIEELLKLINKKLKDGGYTKKKKSTSLKKKTSKVKNPKRTKN